MWGFPACGAFEGGEAFAGVAPVCLSLAQILDAKVVEDGSVCSTTTADASSNDVHGRKDGTIALAIALADQFPCSTDPTAPAPETKSGKQSLCATQPISLHASLDPLVPGMPCSFEVIPISAGLPCAWPQRLFLSEHLAGEDACDVKEDFLATPLPFVGVAH